MIKIKKKLLKWKKIVKIWWNHGKFIRICKNSDKISDNLLIFLIEFDKTEENLSKFYKIHEFFEELNEIWLTEREFIEILDQIKGKFIKTRLNSIKYKEFNWF